MTLSKRDRSEASLAAYEYEHEYEYEYEYEYTWYEYEDGVRKVNERIVDVDVCITYGPGEMREGKCKEKGVCEICCITCALECGVGIETTNGTTTATPTTTTSTPVRGRALSEPPRGWEARGGPSGHLGGR